MLKAPQLQTKQTTIHAESLRRAHFVPMYRAYANWPNYVKLPHKHIGKIPAKLQVCKMNSYAEVKPHLMFCQAPFFQKVRCIHEKRENSESGVISN